MVAPPQKPKNNSPMFKVINSSVNKSIKMSGQFYQNLQEDQMHKIWGSKSCVSASMTTEGQNNLGSVFRDP